MMKTLKALAAGVLVACGLAFAAPAQALPAGPAPAMPMDGAAQVENVARVCDWRGCYYTRPRLVVPYYARPRFARPRYYRPRYMRPRPSFRRFY
jgi:hypothetical protein